MNCLLLLY